MLFILVTMVVIVVVAGLVVAFVAFPHRGEEIPGASWLGEAMDRAADRLPTIDQDADPSGQHAAPAGLHSSLREDPDARP